MKYENQNWLTRNIKKETSYTLWINNCTKYKKKHSANVETNRRLSRHYAYRKL